MSSICHVRAGGAIAFVMAWSCSAPLVPAASKAPLNRALLTAIRQGDAAAVRSLLDRGADVNARDETGATALMHAALNADVALVQFLLRKGAEVNLRNRAGATALLWALHDPAKVKLLVDHGADVGVTVGAAHTTPVHLAAGIPGALPTLKLLLKKGARLKASASNFTPLMAACLSGDREIVQFLIDRGADVKARNRIGFTALHAAALFGDAALVGLLLDHGAGANAKVILSQPADDISTPLLTAAQRGDAAIAKLLLERGADVNVQEGQFARSPLLCAATAGSAETVKLLLAKGAKVDVQDWTGSTPLQWARRRGPTAIVKLLEAAGAKASRNARSAAKARANPITLGAGSVRRALARSLPLLQRSGQAFTRKRGCVSCHHQSLVAMTVGLARRHGIAVNEMIAKQERENVLRILGKNLEIILQGGGVTDPPVPAYTLVGLAAERQQPNRMTDALVHFLVLQQRKDGHWKTPVNRPPHDASDFTFTALSVRGLRLYAPQGRRREIDRVIGRAHRWLRETVPPENEDKAFRLLGLRWAGAARQPIAVAAAGLLREQRTDGGWAQLATLPSDAYATGQVLFALHEAGTVRAGDPAYRRGVEFLLRAQQADGSWFVATRSFPFQPYFPTGFPHGRSQFISAAATAWASMPLTLTVPGGRR
jgi:ankyrin repeat protein